MRGGAGGERKKWAPFSKKIDERCVKNSNSINLDSRRDEGGVQVTTDKRLALGSVALAVEPQSDLLVVAERMVVGGGGEMA